MPTATSSSNGASVKVKVGKNQHLIFNEVPGELPPYGEVLKPEEIDHLVAYLATFK